MEEERRNKNRREEMGRGAGSRREEWMREGGKRGKERTEEEEWMGGWGDERRGSQKRR